jgi:thiol-disulfide isomerase/thioredoxin
MIEDGRRTAKQRLVALGGLVVIVGVAVVVLLAAGILGGGGDAEAVELQEAPAVDGVTEVGPSSGKVAPDFVISDFDGSRHRLSDRRGKVVYINFWATWCDPCQKELPDIARLQEEYGEDLVVIAVNRREPTARAEEFFANVPTLDGGQGVDFPVNGLDPDDTLFLEYRGLGMPTSIFVSPGGVITGRTDGIMSLEEMRSAVENAYGRGD